MSQTNFMHNERILRELSAGATGTWAGWTTPVKEEGLQLGGIVSDITDRVEHLYTSLNPEMGKALIGVIHEDLHPKHPIFTTDVGSDWLGDGQRNERKFIRVAGQAVASFWNNRVRWNEEIHLIPNFGQKFGTTNLVNGLPSTMWFPDKHWRPNAHDDMILDHEIQECFRVLYHDEEAGTYIVQSSGRDHHGVHWPGDAWYTIIGHTGPLFVISDSMVHNFSLDTLFDGPPANSLGFGDYIVLTGVTPKDYLDKFSAWTPDMGINPVRGVHAENGLYDLVINSGPWKQFDCRLIGVPTEKTRFKHFPKEHFGDGAPRRAYGLGELFALTAGVNRLHSVITIASDSQIPVNPDKPDWIDTAFDHRENKTVDLRPTPVGGKSDIIRCQNCNGRVFIYTESSGEPGFARCPHCRDNEGLQFPQLLNATVTAKETPVEGEDE